MTMCKNELWLKLENNEKTQKFLLEYDINKVYISSFIEKKWHLKIKEIKPTLINTNKLITLLDLIEHNISSGLTIHETLSYAKQHSPKIAIQCDIILDKLNKGDKFSSTLKKISQNNLHGYCDLHISKSTPEQFIKNITLLRDQLKSLKKLTTDLVNLAIYPFFIIQISLVLWMTSSYLEQKEIDQNIILIYLSICIAKFFFIYTCYSGKIISFLELFSKSFRLNKVFQLLISAIESGQSLQSALFGLTKLFSNKGILSDLHSIHYKLKLGIDYHKSFPEEWISPRIRPHLEASSKNGNINHALKLVQNHHEKNWKHTISMIRKIFPAIALVIAGIFVSQTLLSLYKPFMEIGT